MYKYDYIQIKNCCSSKIPEDRFKNWETEPKGLLSRIYEELLQVNEKTANNPTVKGYE